MRISSNDNNEGCSPACYQDTLEELTILVCLYLFLKQHRSVPSQYVNKNM